MKKLEKNSREIQIEILRKSPELVMVAKNECNGNAYDENGNFLYNKNDWGMNY